MLTVNSHNPVDIAYVDFSNAFDAVYHCELICKLQSFSMGGKLSALTTDYLSHRTQIVKIEGQLYHLCPLYTVMCHNGTFWVICFSFCL